MVDHFVCLGEPRRPWLEPEALKQKFLKLSIAAHPDRVHHLGADEKRVAESRAAELNAAYQCLREPKDRLRHLLELERGAKPNELQEIPPGLMDLFLEVSTLCRKVDNFLVEKAAVTSPLLKVQVFARGQVWSEELTGLQVRIKQRLEELRAALLVADEKWSQAGNAQARAALLTELEEIYRLLSYFGRWEGQIQERFLRLSF